MAKDTKKGFLLYFDYRKHLTLLTDEQRGKLLLALMDYGEKRTPPELDGAAMMAFSFIAGQMDRDAEKYSETCKKRSESGKSGGRPPKANASDDADEKAKKANGFSQKQTKAKKPDKDTNNDNDTNNDIDNISPLTPQGEKAPDVQERRFAEFWDFYPKKVGKKYARNAWSKIKPDAELHKHILIAVVKQTKSEQWRRENGRFIPHPTTWLNGGYWDNEIEEVSAHGSDREDPQPRAGTEPDWNKGFKSADDE